MEPRGPSAGEVGEPAAVRRGFGDRDLGKLDTKWLQSRHRLNTHVSNPGAVAFRLVAVTVTTERHKTISHRTERGWAAAFGVRLGTLHKVKVILELREEIALAFIQA
jgi:hypothetical protein